MKRSTCHGCPALNKDGNCTLNIGGRTITITPDVEQGCCAAPDDKEGDNHGWLYTKPGADGPMSEM